MERVTLSLEPKHTELLDELEDEWGTKSRSATARRVFEEYEERMNSAHDSSHDIHTDFTRRLDELEERVDHLEAERQLGDRARDVQEAETEELEELQDLIDEDKEADRSESAQPGRESGERTADSEVDSHTVHADAGDARDDVARAVARVAESWSDDPDRLEARKAAATVVLTAALEADAIGRAEAVEGYFHEYPVPGQSERTWWRKNVRPVLSEYGEYSQGQQGYVVDDLD